MNEQSSERISLLRDVAVFLRGALGAPTRTGAVVPSSRWLARKVTAVLGDYVAPNVVELGPGTGPMTRCIQQRLAGTGRHVAVELNPRFAYRLARRFPSVEVICDTAAALPQLLSARGVERVDVFVSSLPFSVIPDAVQRDIIDGVRGMLHPERGVFTTVNYVGASSTSGARKFRALLLEQFDELVVSRPVLRNVPPAYVLTARRARGGTIDCQV